MLRHVFSTVFGCLYVPIDTIKYLSARRAPVLMSAVLVSARLLSARLLKSMKIEDVGTLRAYAFISVIYEKSYFCATTSSPISRLFSIMNIDFAEASSSRLIWKISCFVLQFPYRCTRALVRFCSTIDLKDSVKM